MTHKPVLLNEVLENLNPQSNQNIIDGTVGQGGYIAEILRRTAPLGKVIGIDLDPSQIENCRSNLSNEFGDRLILVSDSYKNIDAVISQHQFENISGVILDLGFSSWQLDAGNRGFTFQKDEPLDMRYNPNENEITAEIIVNEYPKDEIQRILEVYGEEDFAKRIAQKIVDERKRSRIVNTFALAEIIKESTPSAYWRGRIHYATRTFQALRIAVNKELENLEIALPKIISALPTGGRLLAISFHSLEDRIVKHFLKEKEGEGVVTLLHKKPIEATEEEQAYNPRSRSAKLRVAEKK